jgi:cbb3-type cytochrome oxidase subunit 1
VIWQDIVMMSVGFAFAFFLIPSIRGKEKPARFTCITTSMGLFVIAICLATLQLWLAAVAQGMTAIAWAILTVQTLRRKSS